jgi:hypothetical protein
MTPVDFTFLTPDGKPVALASVEIQLLQAGYDAQETGVIMPRVVAVTTDEAGKVQVPLQPSNIAYQVTVFDNESDAGLSYKFYVPLLTPPNTSVRLQDIIVDTEMGGTVPYDQAALLTILEAKANSVSAATTAIEKAADAAVSAATANSAIATVLASEDRVTQLASEVSGDHQATLNLVENIQVTADIVTNQAGVVSAQAAGAVISAQAAEDSAGAAAVSATLASTKAGDAATSAGAAAGSATAANTSAVAAAGSATAANTSAQAAAQSATNIGTAAQTAVDNATLAQKWATYTGGAVEGELLSAKAYAAQAAAAAAGAVQGQINSDWLETSPAAKSYIANKPVLKPVATTGNYADLTGKPVIPTVPTKVSDLANDTGFTTVTLVRQALSATGDLHYDPATGVFNFTTPTFPSLAPVAYSNRYSDLDFKPVIPSDTADLSNSAGYLTSATTPVRSVAGKTGTVTLAKNDVGLGNVDNTADLDKPISTAVQAALNTKADGSQSRTTALLHAMSYF